MILSLLLVLVLLILKMDLKVLDCQNSFVESYEVNIKFCIKTSNAEKIRLAAGKNDLRLHRQVNQ